MHKPTLKFFGGLFGLALCICLTVWGLRHINHELAVLAELATGGYSLLFLVLRVALDLAEIAALIFAARYMVLQLIFQFARASGPQHDA
jgi:hypothetical protein